MDTDTTDFARLEVLVYRILDAETLSQAEAETLLQESEAASQARAAGDSHFSGNGAIVDRKEELPVAHGPGGCAMVWRLHNKQRDLGESAPLPDLLIR